jgi:hypothetical protein
MVTFFELKNGIPDDIFSLVRRSLPDAKKRPCKRARQIKVILQIAKGKEQSSMGSS